MTDITKIILPGFPYVEAFKSCVSIQMKQLNSTILINIVFAASYDTKRMRTRLSSQSGSKFLPGSGTSVKTNCTDAKWPAGGATAP